MQKLVEILKVEKPSSIFVMGLHNLVEATQYFL